MATQVQDIAAQLGGKRALRRSFRTDQDINEAIREGFPQEVVAEVMHSADITLKELAESGGSVELRINALWTLEGLSKVELATLRELAGDADRSIRREAARVAGNLPFASEQKVTLLAPLTDAEARAWAEADLRARARRFVTVVGTTAGMPELAVAARLTLAAVGAPFGGDGYYVTRTRHTFARDAGGLRVHFTAERATLNSGGAR